MRNPIPTVLIVVVLLLSAGELSADSWSPSPSCDKPSKPYQFTSQWQLDSFNLDVERYRRCIEDFVDEQNDAVDKHRRAAEEAIEKWNWFVRYELN